MHDRSGGIPRYRRQAGPALLDQGFRPFFLGAGVYAVVALGLWLMTLEGLLVLPGAFDPLTWHVHEMLFGYVGAAMAGFLLTAIPNWTGGLPLQGLPLLGLFLLWLAGRVAVAISAVIGAETAAAIDLAFPGLFLAIVLREILAGRNWRNLPIVLALTVWLSANVLMHLEPLGVAWTAAFGIRLGIAIVVLLIVLIGGRIVPSFTRNRLAKEGSPRLPAGFGPVDRVAMAATAVALVSWLAAPGNVVTAAFLAAAALLNAWRLSRWRGLATLSEPLLFVLHLGYAWIPAGLGLLAAAVVGPAVPPTTALHALTVGGFGTMTLAVMTRATLGHTGRALSAGPATTAIIVAITTAAGARVASGLITGGAPSLLMVSGLLWIAAFLLFLAVYAPMLTRARPATR